MKAINIYFNSHKNYIEIKDIINNLTPLENKMNQSKLSSMFTESNAYGNIDKDLLKIQNGYVTNYIMKSLPMESIQLYLDQNLPFILLFYTLFSHSESSWDNITMFFNDLLISLKYDARSQPVISSYYVTIIMHSPNTLPYEGYSFVNPGYEYVIRYSKWDIIRLGKGYDTDCREYDPKVYTRNDCIYDCYQQRAKYYCRTDNIVSCPLLRKKSYFEQSNLNFSKCQINRKIINEILELCYGHCNQECHITYYSFTISDYKEIDMYQLDLQIRHNHMPDLTIRHIPEMPFLTFLCNFGGILGMWLGVSFVDILNRVWNLLRVKILSKFSNININNMNINFNNNTINNINPRINNILFIRTNHRRNIS